MADQEKGGRRMGAAVASTFEEGDGWVCGEKSYERVHFGRSHHL